MWVEYDDSGNVIGHYATEQPGKDLVWEDEPTPFSMPTAPEIMAPVTQTQWDAVMVGFNQLRFDGANLPAELDALVSEEMKRIGKNETE